MGTWTIGGNFLADGTVRSFAAQRTRAADAPDGTFRPTYSELYNPTTGGNVQSNASAYWKIGLKNLRTGKIFWCRSLTGGGGSLGNSGWFNLVQSSPAAGMRKGDSYVVVCQSFYNQRGGLRIRFGGTLNVP